MGEKIAEEHTIHTAQGTAAFKFSYISTPGTPHLSVLTP